MSHVSEFFRGYPSVTEGAAAFRHLTSLIGNGTAVEKLAETAATAHVIEGSLLSFYPGTPDDVFTGEDGRSASDVIAQTPEGHDLLIAGDKFDDLMQKESDNLQMGCQIERSAGEVKAINPVALFQLIMTIWELWKSIRS